MKNYDDYYKDLTLERQKVEKEEFKDPFFKFKRFSLRTNSYDKYLEYSWENLDTKSSTEMKMDYVTMKILKGEVLSNKERSFWMKCNYQLFSEEDQKEV